MMIHPRTLVLSLLLAVGGTAMAAGTVDVRFVGQDGYTDAGVNPTEKADNLGQLDRHLQQLGTRYLRNGETLTIDVLDVDLAGNTRLWARNGNEVRIVRGRADWPRLELRYTLQRDGQAVRSGTERLADMDYTHTPLRVREPTPLQYEKTMLDEWFKRNFAELQAAR